MNKLTRQNAEDLLVGSEILGTGGGGSVDDAQEMIKTLYDEQSLEFNLIDPTELPDDELVAIVSMLGGGVSEKERGEFASYLKSSESIFSHRPLLNAIKEMSTYLRKDFYAYVPCEIGPANTILPMYIGALTGKPCVDGDACGRSKPELPISTTALHGIPCAPMGVVSPCLDFIIVKKAVDDYRAERLTRYLARASGGAVGVVRSIAKGRDYKQAIIPNSITRSIAIGRAIREARERNQNPVEAFMEVTEDAYNVFRGKVKSWTKDEKEGFISGIIEIDGIEQFKGDRLKIWYKNEYLISWKNGKPYVMCPDSICVVDTRTCRGLSNWAEKLSDNLGKDVTVFGLKAADIWRTHKGLEMFSPKYFGFNIEYIPLEQVALSKS